LDTVLDALYGARGDIFEEIFSRSWSLLSEPARRVLMVMPIFATSASKAAIEAASDVHKWDLDEGLGQLVEMWLVEASSELDEAKRRYNVHPLTKAFAGARLRENELEVGMRLRVAEYFAAHVKQHGGSQRDLRAYDRLEDELENILAAMEWCYQYKGAREKTKLWRMIIDSSEGMADFLWSRGYWNERLLLSQRAAELSEALEDWESVGRQTYSIGWIHYWQNNLDMAEELAQQSLIAMERTENPRNIALPKRLFGLIALGRKDYEKAEQLLKEVREVAPLHGVHEGTAAITGDLCIVAYQKGDYAAAQKWQEEALALHKQLGDKEGFAIGLSFLGHIAQKCGDLTRARQIYTEGLQAAREIKRVITIGRCTQGLAQVAEKEADYHQSLTLAREALEIFERVGLKREIKETRELVERLEKRVEERRR
jgi:tetratricopeptide (TPR) repeat protein